MGANQEQAMGLIQKMLNPRVSDGEAGDGTAFSQGKVHASTRGTKIQR